MQNNKRATIKDVAALAEVSVATVSRVLSNADYPVSADLRAQVQEAAKELSFAYTTAPRLTKGNGTKEIALVVPNISNPFYMQTVQGISSVCYEKEYQLVLCNSQRDPKKESRYLNDLCIRKVDGVIISSVSEESCSLNDFVNRGMAFVQLDQRYENDSSDSINYDSRLGARIAVRHLIENGHRRIAFASTRLSRWTRKEIYKGYNEQLTRAGIEPDDGLVFIRNIEDPGDWDNYEVQAGEALAQEIVESDCGATAVFCVNDMVAFGVIHGLAQLGLSVPEDMSVVGFDDIPFAAAFVPSLTTIHCPAYETGRLAAMVLIDRLENKGAASILNMNMQPSLVQRMTVRRLEENG